MSVKAGPNDANASIPAIFSSVFGLNGFTSKAQAIAIYAGGIQSTSGLRPVYMCQTGWDKAIEYYGDATKPLITFYGDHLQVGELHH